MAYFVGPQIADGVFNVFNIAKGQFVEMTVTELAATAEKTTVFGFADGAVDCTYASCEEFLEVQKLQAELVGDNMLRYVEIDTPFFLGDAKGKTFTMRMPFTLPDDKFAPYPFVAECTLGSAGGTSTWVRYIEIPESVEHIRSYVSRLDSGNCIRLNLQELNLGDKKRSYDAEVFGACLRDGSYFWDDASNNIGALSIWTDEISYGCFARCVITSLKIVDGTKAIGEKAFVQCTLPEIVELPPSIESIGSSAFSKTKGMQEIHFSGSMILHSSCFADSELRSIDLSEQKLDGVNILANCEKLTSVRLPKGTTILPASFLTNCIALTEKEIHGRENLCSFDKNSLGGTGIQTFDFAKDIVCIGTSAFFGTALVTADVHFSEQPDCYTTLGYGAFQYCGALQSVRLSGVLCKTEKMVFGYCPNLALLDMQDLTLKDDLKEWFAQCDSLKTVYLPRVMSKLYEDTLAEYFSDIEVIRLPKNCRYGRKKGSLLTDAAIAERLSGITFEVYKGTAGEKYCKLRNLRYRYVTVRED